MKKTCQILLTVVVCLAVVHSWDAPERIAKDFTEASKELHQTWQKFKTSFEKKYAHSHDEMKRFNIFAANYMQIVKHNAKFARGEEKYQMGINQFADMTEEEFQTMASSKINMEEMMGGIAETLSEEQLTKLQQDPTPVSIDWRDLGAVTPVQYQGQCGSCYVFGAIAAMEAAHKITNGELVKLSEQQVVDCGTSADMVNGCAGGGAWGAYKYFSRKVNTPGAVKAIDYPYVARKQPTCNITTPAVTTLKTYTRLPKNETLIAAAIGLSGPVMVSINTVGMTYYKGGIYTNPQCTPDNTPHVVAVVGYGSENGTDFWLIKNSWGDWWAEKGYIRIQRNKGNLCGVANAVFLPTVNKI